MITISSITTLLTTNLKAAQSRICKENTRVQKRKIKRLCRTKSLKTSPQSTWFGTTMTPPLLSPPNNQESENTQFNSSIPQWLQCGSPRKEFHARALLLLEKLSKKLKQTVIISCTKLSLTATTSTQKMTQTNPPSLH